MGHTAVEKEGLEIMPEIGGRILNIAELGKLVAALAKAKREFPDIPKNKSVMVRMKSGGSYKFAYADLPAILDAITPPLSKNGLVIVQQPTMLNDIFVMESILLHESGAGLLSYHPLHADGDMQDHGSEETYARRYAISAILGLASQDDDDANIAAGNGYSDKSANRNANFDKAKAHKYYFANTIEGLFLDEDVRHSKQKEITAALYPGGVGKASESDFVKADYAAMKKWADAERERRGRQKNGSKGKQTQPDPTPEASDAERMVDPALEAIRDYWETLASTLEITTPEAKYYLGEILLVNMDDPGDAGLERVHNFMETVLPDVDASKIKASVAKSIVWRDHKDVTERVALELIRKLSPLPEKVIKRFMVAMGVVDGAKIRDISPGIFPQWRSALPKAKFDCDYEDPPEDSPGVNY